MKVSRIRGPSSTTLTFFYGNTVHPNGGLKLKFVNKACFGRVLL